MNDQKSIWTFWTFVIVAILVPAAAGILFWFLGFNFFTKGSTDPQMQSLAWALLGWVCTTGFILLVEFIIALRQGTARVQDALSRLAAVEGSFSEQVTRAVAPHVVRLLAEPTQNSPFLSMAMELTRRALGESFTTEGFVQCFRVTDAKYCDLLKEACALANESIVFTCLETPYWFMQSSARQVHLEAMNTSHLSKERKMRIVIFSDKSEARLLGRSEERFREANDKPQLEAIVARDHIRWEGSEESEVHWFEGMNSNTTLLWTLAAKLRGSVSPAAITDFGIFDDVFYMSYNFEQGVLSCAWNPAILEEYRKLIAEARRQGARGALFFDRFSDMPEIDERDRDEYRAEENR